MFEPPQDNLNKELRDRLSNLDTEKNLDNIDANLSLKNVAIRQKQLEKLFAKLIIFGLALGIVLGIGTYYLVNRLGLNKKPYQIEQEKIERVKQQQAYLPEKTMFLDFSESSEFITKF